MYLSFPTLAHSQEFMCLFLFFCRCLKATECKYTGTPEEKRLVARSLLLLILEKKSSVKYPGQPRSGTVGEEDLCMCPRPVPQGPSAWHPVSFLHAYSNPVGTGERPLDCVRTLPSPRMSPFRVERCDVQLWKVKVPEMLHPQRPARSLKGRPW